MHSRSPVSTRPQSSPPLPSASTLPTPSTLPLSSRRGRRPVPCHGRRPCRPLSPFPAPRRRLPRPRPRSAATKPSPPPSPAAAVRGVSVVATRRPAMATPTSTKAAAPAVPGDSGTPSDAAKPGDLAAAPSSLVGMAAAGGRLLLGPSRASRVGARPIDRLRPAKSVFFFFSGSHFPAAKAYSQKMCDWPDLVGFGPRTFFF